MTADTMPPMEAEVAKATAEHWERECKVLRARVETAQEVIRDYLFLFPAFRAKPEGAPGSAVRREQDKHIALEDRAKELVSHEPQNVRRNDSGVIAGLEKRVAELEAALSEAATDLRQWHRTGTALNEHLLSLPLSEAGLLETLRVLEVIRTALAGRGGR